MIERLNIIKFEFTFVGADDLDKHPNNRLIDKDFKKTLKENLGMKQAFIQLLFKYAFENLNKELRPPIESVEAKEEYLEEIDDVKQFLEEFVIRAVSPKDRIKTQDLFEEFKRRNEPGTSFREFSQASGRNGLTKSTTYAISYIRQVKLKTTTDKIGFIEDSDSD